MLFGIMITVPIAALAAVLGYAATKPDTFRLQRATSIRATREKVFALIEDFHAWRSWSPWERMDPALKRAYSGAPSGRGAVYEWEGSNKVGKGRMEIVEASAPSRIAIRLDFFKPFKASNRVEFTLEPEGEAIRVTWAMHGPVPYPAKIVHVFVDMDRMVGKDFEAGLTNLKTLAEAPGLTRP